MGCASSTVKTNQTITQPNDVHKVEDSKQLLQTLINSNKISFNPHIILLGDSVLDNIVWLDNKSARMDLCAQLNKDLQVNVNLNHQAISTKMIPFTQDFVILHFSGMNMPRIDLASNLHLSM